MFLSNSIQTAQAQNLPKRLNTELMCLICLKVPHDLNILNKSHLELSSEYTQIFFLRRYL